MQQLNNISIACATNGLHTFTSFAYKRKEKTIMIHCGEVNDHTEEQNFEEEA
jgi:hypothetical protein